mmetsp:Transcript_107668/g.313231  ORF Transcript_107668/g.313231 Transcript_107668/m.313231 type:complete len:234 (-) Transcript_107668:234-935(-)
MAGTTLDALWRTVTARSDAFGDPLPLLHHSLTVQLPNSRVPPFARCLQILLFILYLLLLDANMTGGRQAIAIACVLVLTNLALLSIVFIDVGIVTKKRHIQEHRLEERHRAESRLTPLDEQEEEERSGSASGVEMQALYGTRESMETQGVHENPIHRMSRKPMATTSATVEAAEDAAPGPALEKLEVVTDAAEAPNSDSPWIEVVDDQGRPYYHNTKTNTTSWEKPAGMEEGA